MRRESSILARSSRFRKMFRAGGQVPAHTVAPASASALAMAKPYPPSSATPATRALFPRRSILSISPPPQCGIRNAECGMSMCASLCERPPLEIPHSALRIPHCFFPSASDKKARRHRNQLWVPDQRVAKDPTQRPPPLGNPVGRARERIEALVIQVLERPLESIVLEMIVPEQLHPSGVKRRQPARTRVSSPDRGGRDPASEPPGFHGVHDAAPGERVDHMGSVSGHQDADGIGQQVGPVHDYAAYRAARLLTERV